MRLRRNAPRPERESVVALIDVTFFLLVFFMLVGRLDATAPFAVLPPRAETGADLPGGGITLSMAPDGALAVDGEPAEPGAIAALTPRLASGVLVRLNADQATPVRDVLGLVGRLEAAGAAQVVLIVTPGAAP